MAKTPQLRVCEEFVLKYVLILLCLASLLSPLFAADLTVEEWQEKKQELEDFLHDHALAVEAGEELPIKCLTPLILELDASRPDKSSLDIDARRDDLPLTYGTTHFLFHYTTTGTDSVYEPNLQDSLAGVPNYVYNAGLIAETVYDKYTDMGFDQPPSDGAQAVNGGDGRYDIYFVNDGNYGSTWPEEFVGVQTKTSYILLENDYQGFNYIDRLEPLSVTIAHEYFHSIQFGYDIYEVDVINGGALNPSWIEMSAVFMEEYHYDSVNDYYLYTPYFYLYPQWSIRRGFKSGTDAQVLNMYGTGIWPIYLDEKFPSSISSNIVREIWDSCRVETGSNWWQATDGVIKRRTSDADSIESMFTEFNVWNAFTGARTRTGEYFSEAAGYFMPLLAEVVNTYPATVQVHDTLLPDNFGANYIMLNNVSSLTQGLRIVFSPQSGYDWALQVIGLPTDVQNGTVWVDPTIYTQDDQIIPVPTASNFNKILLIPAVLSSDSTARDYSLVLSPLGEGVFTPSGGEQWYAGETHRISWVLDDSTLAIDIELSIDSGYTWIHDTTLANLQYIYDWEVPETPSNECFIRIVDAENSDIADTSGMFSILVTEGSQVKDPYPNPSWMHLTEVVTFKGIIEASATDPTMKVTILNLAGEKINDILPIDGGTGELTVEWDYTNNSGEKVAAGAYVAVIVLNGEATVKKFMVLR